MWKLLREAGGLGCVVIEKNASPREGHWKG